ncbi:hypothetical protein C0J52_24545, partial [Blattella germanica]
DSPSLKYFIFDEPKEGNVPITIKTKFSFIGDQSLSKKLNQAILSYITKNLKMQLTCEAFAYIFLEIFVGIVDKPEEIHPHRHVYCNDTNLHRNGLGWVR